MSLRQTYSCFLVLLILMNKETTPLEVNQGSQGPSLFTTRLEELWQTHDHFCPRCDETSSKDICHPAEKFLPSNYNHQTSSLEADLLFGHPFGPGLVKMRDNSCVLQTFYLGAPVGVAAFFKRGNLLWLREAGVQWSRRSLGPIVSCPTRYITYIYYIYIRLIIYFNIQRTEKYILAICQVQWSGSNNRLREPGYYWQA